MEILIFLIFIQKFEALKSVSTEIKNVDQKRCPEVPVFPYPAENINCEGFVGYGEKCIHKCGSTYIESKCEKIMVDLGEFQSIQPKNQLN